MALKFQWINSGCGNEDHDEDTRRIIRVQAMKEAAVVRKKSGTWGKQNRRQDTVIRVGSSQRARVPRQSSSRVSVIQDLSRTDARGDHELRAPNFGNRLDCPGRPMPLNGFELLVTSAGLNILDLDELTCISVGQRASLMLSQGPTNLKTLIARRRESYLVHLPSRYGKTACLEDALRYLATKAKGFLSSTHQDIASNEPHLYGKALHSLQRAIDNGHSWENADVLCAIQVLSICEILSNPPRPLAWESHVSGAYRLIRAMGPTRFTSDFEKSLIVSMIGPILCECLRLRQPCFFEEPAWQSVIRSVILSNQDFSPRCASYYVLSTIGAKIPRLFMEMHHAVVNRDSISNREIGHLESRCRGLKKDLAAWRQDYDIRSAAYNRPNDVSSRQANMRNETLCSGLVMQSMICRFLGALSLSDRIAEEKQAVMHSKHLIGLHREIVDSNDFASFYIEQKLIFAESILATSDLWLRDCPEVEDDEHEDSPENEREPKLINARAFLIWCDGMPIIP